MRLSVPIALALGSLTSQVSARFHHDHLEKRSTSDRCAYLSTALTFVPVPGAPPTVLGTICTSRVTAQVLQPFYVDFGKLLVSVYLQSQPSWKLMPSRRPWSL